jgi:prepilin-type N-terminal cleavage/methylation domain-containing protein
MSARLIRRLRVARLRDDAGMSLTELLVAMALSTIIGAMTIGLFIKITDTTTRSTDRTTNSAAARNTIQAWTNYLRVADGPVAGARLSRIEWLTADDMLFYADLLNRSGAVDTTSAPTMVWLRRDTKNNLIEEQFPGNATSGTSPTLCRALVQRISGTGALFTGEDSKYRPVSAGQAPTPSAGCQKLPVTVPSQQRNPDLAAQATLQNVYLININFRVTDSLGKHPIEFDSQAVLPSLGAVG